MTDFPHPLLFTEPPNTISRAHHARALLSVGASRVASIHSRVHLSRASFVASAAAKVETATAFAQRSRPETGAHTFGVEPC